MPHNFFLNLLPYKPFCALYIPVSVICRISTSLHTAGITFKENLGYCTYYSRQLVLFSYKPVNNLLDEFSSCIVFVAQHYFYDLLLNRKCLIGPPQLKTTLWPLVWWWVWILLDLVWLLLLSSSLEWVREASEETLFIKRLFHVKAYWRSTGNTLTVTSRWGSRAWIPCLMVLASSSCSHLEQIPISTNSILLNQCLQEFVPGFNNKKKYFYSWFWDHHSTYLFQPIPSRISKFIHDSYGVYIMV